MKDNIIESLAHTRWNCKYHIVFAPKYRRKVFFYVSIDTAQNERFGIYGIFEREKQFNNISKVWEYEICIPKPRILVQGILCGYSRKEYENNKRVHIYTVGKR